MTSRDFKGFPSLQEVECTGRSLKPEVKLIALQLYSLPSNRLLASMNVISNECVTWGDYSLCRVNKTKTHKSKIKLLVADLNDGESREYKCTANTYDSYGFSKVFTWTIVVKQLREYNVYFVSLVCVGHLAQEAICLSVHIVQYFTCHFL